MLSEVLDASLPQYAAPLALKRRLAESWPKLHARGSHAAR